MVVRKFQWKIQIRREESHPWRDDGEPPKTVEIPNYKTNQMEKVKNSFRLDDEKPIPEEYYAIPGLRQLLERQVRAVLESVDGSKVTFELNHFDKKDPKDPYIPLEGIAYMKCKAENCGRIVAPGRGPQHYIEFHGKRLNHIKDLELDPTNSKYFEVHLFHGKTIKEAFDPDEDSKKK